MNEYRFTLKFSVKSSALDIDELIERLGVQGCTDALAGIGQPGFIALDFCRKASSGIDAIKSALADVILAIPDAQLVEDSGSDRWTNNFAQLCRD
ncbi:MAG: hypothetical protein ABIK82_01885 [Pseudomonadota bacterium]